MKLITSSLLSIPLVVAASCVGTESGEPVSLEAGAHVLVGSALLETAASSPAERSERMVLHVDASGAPTHVRDERYGEMFALRFGGDVSDDVCDSPDCDLVVERDTACAVWTYREYFRPDPGSDTGHAYTGTVRACPNGETVAPHVTVAGSFEPTSLLPDGELRVDATLPLDPASHAVAILVDGAAVAAAITPVALDRWAVSLAGPVPLGAAVEARYGGGAPLALSASTIETTAVVEDLSFTVAPPEGAIDARGYPVLHEDGALTLRDEGHGPRRPFVVAIALGDPGAASEVALELAETESRFGGTTYAEAVRGDGTSGGREVLGAALPIPSGAGPVWLLLTNAQDLFPPHDLADPLVFALRGIELR